MDILTFSAHLLFHPFVSPSFKCYYINFQQGISDFLESNSNPTSYKHAIFREDLSSTPISESIFQNKNKSLDELLSLHPQEILAQVSSASLFSWNVTLLFLSADCWFLSLFTYLLMPWVLLIPFLFSPSQRIFLCKRATLFCIQCIMWNCIL